MYHVSYIYTNIYIYVYRYYLYHIQDKSFAINNKKLTILQFQLSISQLSIFADNNYLFF